MRGVCEGEDDVRENAPKQGVTVSSKKEMRDLLSWDARRARLEEEIQDLERRLATKQLELLELEGQQEEPIANHVLLGSAGPAYLSDLFCHHNELVLFHVMADCEFCDVWLSSMQSLAKRLQGRVAVAAVSPEPLDRLSQRAASNEWSLPYYSSAACDFSESIGFAHNHGEAAGLLVCQLVEEAIYVAAKAPLGPAPFCSMWILGDLLRRD